MDRCLGMQQVSGKPAVLVSGTAGCANLLQMWVTDEICVGVEIKMNWYVRVLQNYAVFRGRARRREYWMFVLFNIGVVFLLSLMDTIMFQTPADGFGPFYSIYGLAVLLPSIAVTVRRLHDIGKSAWYLLIGFIPFIGAIWLLILTCLDSQPGDNQYGPNPKTCYG